MNVIINKGFRKIKGRSQSEFRTVQVLRHSPRLVEVVAHAEEKDAGAGFFEPGDKIKVDVGGAMRSYTPSVLTDSELRFVGVVHGNGAGSEWLEGLRPGDPVRFFGPARSLPPAPSDIDWAAFAGDETTIGAADALLRGHPTYIVSARLRCMKTPSKQRKRCVYRSRRFNERSAAKHWFGGHKR